MSDIEVPQLPLTTRLWFAWTCFFRVLFDPEFAARAFRARAPELPAAVPSAPARSLSPSQSQAAQSQSQSQSEAQAAQSPRSQSPQSQPPGGPERQLAPAPAASATGPSGPSEPTPALQLLALLQREGRLVDFLEQDIATFSDADIGAAARVVHEGCRKALRAHAKLAPVRNESEGARVTLNAGFSPAEVKLTGNVQGAAPYSGVLVHRGWRATEITLPTAVQGHDARVLAPAEVEL